MKRSSSGRSSLQQPGVLKPRNEDFTPKNRQSAGRTAKKSFLPKMGLVGSAKGVGPRKGRSSIENTLRPIMASSRFTPTRMNTPAWMPQSANRLSTDSARNSGIGASTRKDMRYVTDPAYKTQCIDTILVFLRTRHYNSFQRRTLLTPTLKEFIDIFNFIYQHLDPSYTLPKRFEEEIPKLMKKLHCPIQLTKSSFVTIGTPHTWPAVLAALKFLVDIIHLSSLNQEYSSFPCDQDADDDVFKRLNCCIDLYHCNDEEIIDCFEAYCESIKANFGVSDKDMMDVEKEVQEVKCALESLPETADEFKQIRQCNLQYSDDLVKLNTYLQDLQIALQNKKAMENNSKQIIEELKGEEMKIHEEVEALKTLQLQQGYSHSEIMRLKNHSQEVGKEIEHQEYIAKDISAQVWSTEVEVSKAQSSLRDSVIQFEDLLEKLGVKADFPDIDINSEDLGLHCEDAMHKLTTHMKATLKVTSQAQEKLWEADQDLDRAKGILQEKMAEGKKLETKLRHLEEEQEVTIEEMEREEQLRLEETEMLHQKIIEFHKSHKNPAYHIQQVQDMVNDKKQELESYKKKEEWCLYDGDHFQSNICQEILRSVEVKNNMIVEFKSRIDAKCDEFLEWFDLQYKN